MSSRGGPRAAGTDGSDFSHRERVASHYRTSVVNKSRLKFMCFLHILLVLLVTLKVSPSLLNLFSIQPPPWVVKLDLPPAESWEYVWLFSIQATLFCLVAIPKNNSLLMKQFIVGMLVFGFMPIGFAVYAKGFELLDFVQKGEVKKKLGSFPIVVLWYIFFTIAVQVQGFGIYFAKQLLTAWSANVVKKKQT